MKKQHTYKFNQADGTPAEVKATSKKEAVHKLQEWLSIKIKETDVYRVILNKKPQSLFERENEWPVEDFEL